MFSFDPLLRLTDTLTERQYRGGHSDGHNRKPSRRPSLFVGLALAFNPAGLFAVTEYVPSSVQPPAIARELRGAWVATVGNIDWPSQKGLTTAQQQAELLALLDRAVQLRLNAIFLQIRPSADAFYASPIEPWSEFLTGQMGRAPNPYYDPLEFAVREAHRRRLELHAWLNPYRAYAPQAKSKPSANHVSMRQPNWVRSYGSYLWFDPGEKGVAEHLLNVVRDVVRRYDIDGVTLDDYFYPYPIRTPAGQVVPFPDEPSWKRYQAQGGSLSREDWRRRNVDQFVERLYQTVKAEKRHIRVTISPFGIWRPGFPSEIRGFDAYAQLYADARKWLINGWLDCLAPQLYWDSDAPGQSFPVLLKWWCDQNAKGRLVCPAIAISRVGPGKRGPEEILRQIRSTRAQAGARGHLLWNFQPLLDNRSGLSDALLKDAYAQPALPPAYPWLDAAPPPPPVFQAKTTRSSGGLHCVWRPGDGEQPWRWLLQSRRNGAWDTVILAGSYTSRSWQGQAAPQVLSLRAMDRSGNLSPPAVLERPAPAPSAPARR
jgi:uncharacterized lipoprotein YddW (UPF0748 family)